MSVPLCVAVAITRQGLPLGALSPTAAGEVADLVARVDVQPDAALARLDARIEIETSTGERLVSHWPGNAASFAWSWEEIARWSRALGGELGEQYSRSVERVITAVEGIEQADSVAPLAAATVIER